MKKIPLMPFGAFIFFLLACNLPANPLNQWTWRDPNPQGYPLEAATFGNNQFVAVGVNGTIVTSPDGYHWTNQTSGTASTLWGVAYASGEFAAVGDGGVILVSSNGASWTQIPALTTNTLRGIAGNSGWQTDGSPEFLAVGDYGTTIFGNNGTEWLVKSSGITNALYGISWNSSSYIAVGDAGTVLSLTSSGSFLHSELSVRTTNNLFAVASSGAGYVAAVGDLTINPFGETAYLTNQILYSTDSGTLWRSEQWITSAYDNANLWSESGLFILHGVTFGTNGFVAVGDCGYTLEFDNPGVVFTSSNGTNWTEASYETSENNLYGAAYGNGLYVLVGDAGAIVVSTNLVDWTEVTGYHLSAITALACSTNLCIASALPIFSGFYLPDFTTIVSSNAENWSVSTTTLPGMAALAVAGCQFVGVGGDNIYTTTDGYNWQTSTAFTNALNSIRYLNNRFIAVGDNGTILTSTDGTNWNNYSVSSPGSFNDVAYGNGLYVSAGSIVATSLDSLTWSLWPSNPPAVITRIVYGDGLFDATAYTGSYYYPNGEIMSSEDGVNWQTNFTWPNAITGLAYSGGTFLGITSHGVMVESADGINWVTTGSNLPLVDNGIFSIYYNFNSLSLSYSGYYSTVCAYNGIFLAAGLDGVLVQSGNTWNPASLNTSQSVSNGLTLSYTQQIDVPYQIQASTNLLNWINVYSGIGNGQPTNFVVSISSNCPAQFFRLVVP